MKISIFGIVQGVGFRPTVYRVAMQMGLNGYVLNNGSNVEVHVDRDPEEFVERLKEALPALARIDRVEIEHTEESYDGFSIVESREGKRVSLIPTDTALCEACTSDFQSARDKRHLFPFTNCTECGARFTVITDVPFDRGRTSMSGFPMCPSCANEYASPEDRRFHAQTLSCPECGPAYTLYDGKGRVIPGDPFEEFARRIDLGEVGVLKGWGGMHIVCSFANADRLRRLYRRGDKPYAVMMRDMDVAKEYAVVDPASGGVLSSQQRPIVLLNKTEKGLESFGKVSPGLGNIGVMLPYSAAHMLLFTYLKEDGLIMTSANPPGEPMVIENEKAFDLRLDFYLLHNRRIVHRCDDSVVKMRDGRPSFTRKSRGFVPVPLEGNHDRSVIGVGAQWDVTGSITRNREIFLTQYIGESQQHPTLQFLGEAIHHLARLLGTEEFDAIGMDKHPKYSTKIMARRLAKEYACPTMEVQHYHAHAASLMIDRRIDEKMVFLTWDGTGYGDDGTSWGGETLVADFSGYERACTLEGIPLLGGDRAVLDPKRVVTAIQLALGLETTFADERETELYSKMMGKSVMASSMGRFLDAVSCITGICCKRTYEGEPAIKLERWLEAGDPGLEFEVEFDRVDGVEFAKTMPLFDKLLSMRLGSEAERADAAASVVSALTKALVERACDTADEVGCTRIGFTGGVSYSNPISSWAEGVVRARGLEFVTHERVPNGDSGISVGQNAVVGALLG